MNYKMYPIRIINKYEKELQKTIARDFPYMEIIFPYEESLHWKEVKTTSKKAIKAGEKPVKRVLVPKRKRFMEGYAFLVKRENETTKTLDLTNQEIHFLKEIQGFLGFVSTVALNSKESENIFNRTRSLGVSETVDPSKDGALETIENETTKLKIIEMVGKTQDLIQGEAINVISGPFEGFSGSVLSQGSVQGRIRVELGVLGRLTQVELDRTQLERA